MTNLEVNTTVIIFKNNFSVQSSATHNKDASLRFNEMCSIIGYLGSESASQIIVRGLKKMEYRGYDSVGVSTLFRNHLETRKGVGKVADVNVALRLDSMPGNIGIGHTRWATHGGVSDLNAHPHCCNSNMIAIVHNGIIDNYQPLKQKLKENGFHFKSQTDSEVIANLLQSNWDKAGSVREAMLRTVRALSGSYAFIALFQDGTIAAARYREPLIVGADKSEYFISSDVLGFVESVDDALFLGDKEFVIINSVGLQLFNFDGVSIQPGFTKIANDFLNVQKGDYSHFTLKEIFEQPSTILRAVDDQSPEFELFVEYLKQSRNLYITGSGTSYHAALVGCYLLSKYAKKKAEPMIASEAPFHPNFLDKYSVLLAISQSGESADVLEAVRIAKSDGAKVVSITNSMTSSLVRESSISLGLDCGPEVGVAATKSFTSQLAAFYTLANSLSGGLLSPDLTRVSRSISKVLANSSKIRHIAGELKHVSDVYVLGRGVHFPIALEGSLKIKEITYIHAEGLPAGELKHGPLALMHKDVYVILLNPSDITYTDTLTGAHEIKARGGRIIGISDRPNDAYDHWIEIPTVDEPLFPIVETIPLQLIAYYASIERNADPDYPRNLAKCVTVR